MKIVAIILTYNEQLHLARCINSVKKVTEDIIIIDSYSNDKTLDIAKSHGVTVIQHKWINYSTQFNWGLAQLEKETDWVLRIDADEYMTDELVSEINKTLPSIESSVKGIFFSRRMTFQSVPIKHGGIFPINVIRLFKYGYGQCENRWMDEHIIVSGKKIKIKGELIDDNLNSLTWWINKHNNYAGREAVDLLNLKYKFMLNDLKGELNIYNQASLKRWIKENIYFNLPSGFRAFSYFVYRYLIRLGFLDGKVGLDFHFLQGFWYRYLVDAKVIEVIKYMRFENVNIKRAIKDVLNINID